MELLDNDTPNTTMPAQVEQASTKPARGNSALLSRRSFLTRSGYNVAALLALSLWDGTGAPPAVAGDGGSSGGGTGARLGATSVARLCLPLWGDSAHWDDNHYYTTMQAGRRCYAKTYQFSDVDGDGREEMLICGPQGLEVMKWDAPNTQWIPLPGTPLSDFADNPDGTPLDYKYIATIQTGDIDGDGAHEVVGRFSDGLHFYKYNPVTQTWSSIPGQGFCTDDTGWGDSPSYYQTIQCAPVLTTPNNSSPHRRSQIIARGPTGLVKIDYDSQQWNVMQPQAGSAEGNFIDAGGWKQDPCYWSTIQYADVDGDGYAEILARFAGGLAIYKPNSSGSPLAVFEGWSDNYAWYMSAQYTTIQCADIDGDGAMEMMGNGTRGLETLKYDPVAKKIGYYNPNNPFLNDTSNNYAWGSLPQWYSSIQFADIDGDGAMEMICRAGTPGIMAFKFDTRNGSPTRNTWQRLPEGDINKELSDGNGFDEIQYYQTFQSAHVLLPGDLGYTGDGTHKQAVIMIRGSSCVLTYRWDVPSKTWAFCKNGPPPDFNTDQKLHDAYMAIAPALFYNAPLGIRSKYNDELLNIDIQLQKMYAQPPGTYDTPAAGRPKTTLARPAKPVNAPYDETAWENAWEAVVWQIYWEMRWVQSVHDWFLGGNGIQGIGPLITATFSQEANVLGQVNNYLSTPPEASLAMNIISLIGNMGWAVLGLPELNAGTASAIAGIIGVAAGAAGEQLGSDTYSGTISGLQDAITNGYTAAIHGNIAICNQITGGTDPNNGNNAIPAEYGLLKTFGENIVHGVWSWPVQDLTTPAERAYAIQCWQTLLAAVAFIEIYPDFDKSPYSYPYKDIFNQTVYGLLGRPELGIYSHATHGALFDPINPSEPHPLGINKDWVYRDFSHGWPALPKYSIIPLRSTAPSIAPKIEVSPRLTRDTTTGEIVVSLTIANRGVSDATNVHLTSVKLGSKTNLPNTTHTHNFLRSNYPEPMEVRFPSVAAGTKTVLAIQGKYKGGTFGTSLRVTIPA